VPVEVELKLNVLDVPAIRGLVLDPGDGLTGVTPIGPARNSEVEDRYVDTSDRALWSAGLVARIRTGAGGPRLTVKSAARDGDGAVHRRLELEGDATEDDPPGMWPPSPARDRVVSTVGERPLVALVTLRQRRLQRDLAVGASVVELSLDEIERHGPNGRLDAWTELECELRTGSEADLAALGAILARRGDLAPATMSKLERALGGSLATTVAGKP